MSIAYKDHWVVVTGARDVGVASVPYVDSMITLIAGSRPAGMVFGGARGVDTIALTAAWRARATGRVPVLVAVVPGRKEQQPPEAQVALRLADEIIELGLPLDQPRSYQTRNERMLTEAILRDDSETPVVVAFPLDGVEKGGTRNCIHAAQGRGLDVRVFPMPARGGLD